MRPPSAPRTAAVTTVAAAFITAALASSACSAEPFEAPSAYTHQRVLCGAEHSEEWKTLTEGCRAAYRRDGSCLGYVAFQGTLEGQEIAIHSRLSRTTIVETPSSNPEAPHLDGFVVAGVSPYFNFVLELESVGGSARDAQARTLQLRDRKERLMDDDAALLMLRLSVGGESTVMRARAGQLAVAVPEAHFITGTFSGTFGADGSLDGCFAVLGADPDSPADQQ